MFGIVRDTVCQASFEVAPDKLIGVKLGRISWEVKGMDSRMSLKELLNDSGAVERTSVPEEDDGAPEMTTKVLEELSDLFGSDVSIGIKACVESKLLSSWRNSDGGDSRDFCPTPSDHENRRFSLDRPASLDVGNKRESALIQEGQAGSKPSDLFLYEAKRDVSSSGSRLRVFLWPSWSAPDNSSLEHSSDSIGSLHNSEIRIVSGSLVRYVLESKHLSSNRLLRGLSPERAPTLSFERMTEMEDVHDEAWNEGLSCPSSGRTDASAPRSLKKHPVPEPLSGKYGPASASERPDAADSPTFGVCHEVSLDPPVYPIV